MSGKNVRILRQQLRWTQQQLAEALGLGHKSQISKIESDKRPLSYAEEQLLLQHVQKKKREAG
jgi:transcriptional regulator with XRE-family HTH domain